MIANNRAVRFSLLSALIVASAVIAACSGGGGDDDDDVATTGTPVCTPIPDNLSALQSAIFSPNCALSSCHDSTAPAGPGLDLSSAATTHAETVNQPATQTFNGIAVQLVVPSNATASYLYRKVVGMTGIQGTVMPPPSTGPALCQEKIDSIAAWIEAGAPNN